MHYTRASDCGRPYKPATGATIIGVDVGAAEPASGSSVTATAPNVAISTGPDRMYIAVPPLSDWNRPAGRGAAPPFGITHISYVLPACAGGRFEAISRTPSFECTNTLPRGGAGWPFPKLTGSVAGSSRKLSACNNRSRCELT